MLRNISLVLALSSALGATQASAQNFSKSQRSVMENIAQAFAGTAKCTRYQVNPKLIVLIQLRYGVNVSNLRVSKYIEERAKFHSERIASRTVDDICEAVNRLFGPNGSNLTNLIRPAS